MSRLADAVDREEVTKQWCDDPHCAEWNCEHLKVGDVATIPTSPPTPTHDSGLQSNSDSELLREALDEILSRRRNVISTYERLGPDWTTESCEYESAAAVQAAAEEDVDYIEQALVRLEQGAEA